MEQFLPTNPASPGFVRLAAANVEKDAGRHMLPVKLKKLDSRAVTPEYKTRGAAGADFCALCPNGHVTIEPGATVRMHTGLALHIDNPNWALVLMPRSGLGSAGVILANTVGLIDSDYQGEILIALYNRSGSPIVFNTGDRIAQGVFMPVAQAKFDEVEDFDIETQRGVGGFGSTGKA